MDTFMVTLSDRDGRDSRVLVTAPSTDTEDQVAEYISQPGITGTRGETIPGGMRVLGVRRLRVSHPVRHTAWTTLAKANT